MGNNRLACECLEWLRQRDENIVGIALHPPERGSQRERLLAAAQVQSDRIFDGARLNDPDVIGAIRALRPDIGISILFGYIMAPEFVHMFPSQIVNLHPSYLPYNRGSYPNVWSIVDGTPAGATLHYIDAGIDTGDVIAQREVRVSPIDTGETLYRKLEAACAALFRDVWPLVRSGKSDRRAQPTGEGSCHRRRDVDHIDEIDINRTYRAGDLINILRARTFPPYSGAYFRDGNAKVFVRVQLEYEHASTAGDNGQQD